MRIEFLIAFYLLVPLHALNFNHIYTSSSNVSASHNLRESQAEATIMNSTIQSTTLQTWSTDVCPTDPLAKLQACPATAAWIGLQVNPPCACVPVVSRFADPLSSVGLNMASIYADPTTKLMIEDFQNTLRMQKDAATCGQMNKAAKYALWSFWHDPVVQGANRWVAAYGSDFDTVQSRVFAGPITAKETLEYRDRLAAEWDSQRDYCTDGGRHPLVKGQAKHSPWKGKCFSSSKKIYNYYKQSHCLIKGVYHNKPKCPDPACPPTPQLSSFMPAWLLHTPGECFFTSICQPSVNELFRVQCGATTIAMSHEINKCLQVSKDDTVLGITAPNLDNPGKRLSKHKYKQTAEDYCAVKGNACGSFSGSEPSARDNQLTYFSAFMIGLNSNPYNHKRAGDMAKLYIRDNVKHCVKKAYKKVFGCHNSHNSYDD